MISSAPSQSATSREAIAERFRTACAGMSAAETARLTGSHRENIRRYLKGRGCPPPDVLASFCEVMGVAPAWLLLGQGDPSLVKLRSVIESKPNKQALSALAAELMRRVQSL